MNQTYTFYYVGVGLLLLLLVVVILTALRIRKQKQLKSESADYIRALNALIGGDIPQAVEFFYKTVHHDTENIDAYIKLGNIFRQQGRVDKAIKIHKELLVRRTLDNLTKTEITRSLVQDYYEARNYNKALDCLNSMFAIEPKNIWAKKQQLAIYEAKQDWENAFNALKTLAKWEHQQDTSTRLALYKVEEALQSFQKDKEREGRIHLREAIKIDANCSVAHIVLGDSYVREERNNDAIKVWVGFVKKVPSQSYLVFDRLQEVLYSIGTYGEIENILEELAQDHPDNLEVMFTLADIRIRKGDVDGAIQLCETALEKVPNSVSCKMRLVKLYDHKNENDKALEIALDVADKFVETDRRFQCQNCRYESDKPMWHCPNCHKWNSFNI